MRAAQTATARSQPDIGPIRYEFNAVRNINFQTVLDRRTDYGGKAGPREQGTLTVDANRYTMKLYNRAQAKISQHRLTATKASFNLLICLREGHLLPKRRARRDENSAYTHELAQIIYAVWLFENRAKVDKKIRERLAANDLHPMLRSVKGAKDRRLSRLLLQNKEELDVAGAVAGNHDSMEDLALKRQKLLNALSRNAANDNRTITRVANIIGNISKQPGEHPASWMKRAQKTELTLLCKMLDRSHNVATMLGSGRDEKKINDYLNETEVLLKLANNKIRRNGTLTYMAQYLYDQIDLLRLYYDVKNGTAPMQQLAEKMDKAVKDYRTSTIDRDIHPMLCIVGRILKDPYIIRNLPVPETVLAQVPFDRQAASPSGPKPILGS